MQNIIPFSEASNSEKDELKKSFKTRTAKRIYEVIGDNENTFEYDLIRCKLKKHPENTLYIGQYQQILARLEVIILTNHSNLKNELARMEKEQLKKTSSLTIHVESNEHKDIIKKLKKLQLIKTHLDI